MTVSTPQVPSGQFHEVALGDLFFSTTDKKGVIDQANHVFVDTARIPGARLKGAPHNIIRHPEMPGGAFRIVWETIGRGKPVCAYVLNLAGDGSSYWAFATITPMDGGYISVRARPCVAQTLESVAAIYGRVRKIERDAMAKGESAGSAARIGEQAILDELKVLGFADYEEFMARCLPAEISARSAAREKQGIVAPSRPGAGETSRVLLDAVADMEGLISALAGDLSDADTLAETLDGNVSGALTSLGALEDALGKAQDIAKSHEDDAPVLATATPALAQQCHGVADTMREVLGHVDAMCALRHTLRYATGIAQMQAESAVQFAVDTIDGKEDPETSARGTDTLVASLSTGVAFLQERLAEDRAKADQMRSEIAGAEASLRKTGLLLGRWRDMVAKFRLTAEMGDIIPDLDKALDALGDDLASLHASAERFGESVVAFDAARLAQRMEQARSNAAAMA